MRPLPIVREAWRSEMTPADRVRVVLALCFPAGAFGHFGWVAVHGVFYHGPAPPWAVWFWYGLCALDFIIAWVMLTRPRFGLALGGLTMAASMWVNWTCFPTFEYGPNLVLLGLTGFALTLAALTPWLWRASHWRLRP